MKNKFTRCFRILCVFWMLTPTVFALAQDESNTLTDSVCHCRLFTDLFYGSSYGGSVDVYVGADASGMFFDTALIHVDFNQYGTANHFIDLPLFRWIRVDYHGLKQTLIYVSGPEDVVQGTFMLYDENDSVICAGPEEIEGSILLWNSCSRNIPDSVTALTVNRQENVVNLSWNNPSQTVAGSPLTTVSRIEIRRNEQLVQTFTNVTPGGQLNYTDNLPAEGTYQYSIQCFNEEGDGVPAVKHLLYGSNLTLFDYSHNGKYSDSTCYFSISNDSSYTIGSHAEIAVFLNDSTKMWRISGHANMNSDVSLNIFVGEGDNLIAIEPDSSGILVSHEMITFVFDIPAGATPDFHYTMECVNTLYEQPDTNIAIVPDPNGIIYVTQEGAGLRNGSSWTNATPWLNSALSVADTMTEKPVIWVAAGTYYGIPRLIDGMPYSFVGREGVNVYGGFAGNESADYNLSLRDFEQNETVLDGLSHHTVVLLNNSEWNGFHITKGTNGCSMSIFSVLRNCLINYCRVAGIINKDNDISYWSLSLVDSCSIIDNEETGISVKYLTLTNSFIARNGGTGVDTRAAIIHNCNVTQNGGDGIYLSSSIASVSNSLITNNDQTGIVFEDNGIVLNSTIANNSGNGVYLHSNSILRNSIICGNGGASISNGYWARNHEIANCAIEGDYQLSSNNNIPLTSSNNPSGIQPGFVNPTSGCGKSFGGGNWHLLPNSVCVNRGKVSSDNVNNTLSGLYGSLLEYDNNSVLSEIRQFPLTDLEGNARIRQNIPDIGAFESDYVQADVISHIHPDTNHIIYITENGSGDGSSWQNATSDLTKALEISWLHGSETQIWMAQGTYPTPNIPFYLKENLKLFGGFEGNEPANYPIDLRNTLAHTTVLDGQNQNRVLHQTRDFEGTAVVDGFTLTHGNADQGAGAFLMEGATLSKCRIENNTVTNNDAAIIHAVHDTLKQLIVEHNDGTGVLAKNSHLLHCTVVKNNGYGIHLWGNTTLDSTDYLCNCIIWGNALRNLHFNSAMAQNHPPVYNCAIENQIIDGEGNIFLSSDNAGVLGPHFTNPTDSVGVVTNLGDWQIDSLSICLNAGIELSDSYGIQTDLAGQPRVQNGKADIGALESTYNGEVLCRNIEAFIYEGESYTFYDTSLATTGWYSRRWDVGNADSLVILHLITKQVVYVSVTGSGLKDGSSWANALDGQTATANGSTKLADALQSATANTEFWIQSGTYYACSDSDVTKSLMLNEGVGLYGGFAGIEASVSQRDTNNAPTVFSGNLQNDSILEHYSRNIFKTKEQNTPDNSIVLDNIFVMEGYNNDHTGTALHVSLTTVLYANRCRFHHHSGSAIANEGLFLGNYCSLDSNVSNCVQGLSYDFYYDLQTYYEGAAAFTNKISGVARFNHCAITYNQAPHDGAIFNLGKMTIDSSEVSYNKATEQFIGAILSMGDLTILNTTLSNNQSYKFFSTVASFGSLVMRNCMINDNQSHLQNPAYYWPRQIWLAAYKSAHIMSDGTAEVSHCLFTRNSQNSGTDGGCLHISGKANIHHCDFIKNICAEYSHSHNAFWGDGNNHDDGGPTIIITYRTFDNDGGGIHVENGEVYAENCLFDQQTGMSGTSASVRSGRLTLNHCIFSRNTSDSYGDNSILTNRKGELIVKNSLFANNQNPTFNTPRTESSISIFTNCTFANNSSYLCFFGNPLTPSGCDSTWVNTDTAHVVFKNCIVTGDWGHDMEGLDNGCGVFYPNYTVDFTNTLFDTLHTNTSAAVRAATQFEQPRFVVNVGESGQNVFPTTELLADATLHEMLSQGNVMVDFDSEGNRVYKPLTMPQNADYKGSAPKSVTDCTPDSAGNIYYCDPMFVNPTTVMGFDSVQDPLLYDFRLLPGSPAINSGDTTGLHLTPDATDLAGEWRVKRCQIDRGCYEYGTIVYDTLHETLCVESDSLENLFYSGHGFSHAQIKVGENNFTRTCDCHPDANDTVLTLQLFVSIIQHTAFDTVACDSMVWNGLAYTQSGDFVQTLTDVVGCDSMVTMHLTVKASTASSMEQAVCGSYEWNGITYTESGTYTQTFTNAAGCDSVVTLHLTVNQSTVGDTTVVACNNFTWHGNNYTESGDYTSYMSNAAGCDSIVILHLTIYHDETSEFSITTPDSCYTWNAQTYCSSGDYTQTLQTVHGCDSVVTLHLTITVGIDDHDGLDFKVYPNPTSSIVNVECIMTNDELGGMEMHLYDAYGRLLDVVETARAPSLQTAQIDLSRYASGIYFIKAVTDGKTVAVRKVVKQ